MAEDKVETRVVPVLLREIFGRTEEEFERFLCLRAFDSLLPLEVNYAVVGAENGVLIVSITADLGLCFGPGDAAPPEPDDLEEADLSDTDDRV